MTRCPGKRAKGEATLDDQNKRPKGAVIVPYGHVWRTGANEATQFVVTDDVLINGQKLAAGSYSLHTIPTKDEWTIVFNGTANQWGSFDYDPAKDTLRVKAKPQWLNDSQEWLAYSFDPVTDDSAQVNIRWEKISVPFTVKVADVAATTLAQLKTTVAMRSLTTGARRCRPGTISSTTRTPRTMRRAWRGWTSRSK